MTYLMRRICRTKRWVNAYLEKHMLKFIVITSLLGLLLPQTLIARYAEIGSNESNINTAYRQQGYLISQIYLDSGVKTINKYSGDCVKCGRNLEEQAPASDVIEGDFAQVVNEMNTDDFSQCFAQYNSQRPSQIQNKINTITPQNYLYVCGCISGIMEEKPVEPLKRKTSHFAQSAIADMGVSFAVEDMRIQAKAIENDLNGLPHQKPLKCDIENHMQQKRKNCHNRSAFYIKKGLVQDIPKERISFENQPSFTIDDFIVAPALTRALEGLNQAIEDGEIKLTYEEIANLSDQEIQRLLRTTNHNIGQTDIDGFFSAPMNLSRSSISNGIEAATTPHKFGAAVNSSQNFAKFLSNNYLSLFDDESDVHKKMNTFFNESATQTVAQNREQVSSLLNDVVDKIATAKCKSIKKKFDAMCNAKSPQEILSTIPETFERAYARVHELTYKPQSIAATPGLKLLDSVLKNFSHSLSEVNHMISCQNHSQSIAGLYEICPDDIAFEQMNSKQKNACANIRGFGGEICQSYQALFANDKNFKQAIIDANIGINSDDEDIDRLLFVQGKPQTPHTCLNFPNNSAFETERERAEKFRSIVDEYMANNLLDHVFASDVVTTDTFGDIKAQSDEQNSGCSYCSVSSSISSNSQSVTGSQQHYQEDTSSSLIPHESGQVPQEISDIIPQELNDSYTATPTDSNNFVGPFNPVANYATNGTEIDTNEQVQTQEKKENSNEDKIASLMAEIDRLNNKLSANSEELSTNTKQLSEPTITPNQKEKLDLEREKLLLEQERLQLEKKQQEKKLAETKAEVEESTSVAQKTGGETSSIKQTQTDQEQSVASSGGSVSSNQNGTMSSATSSSSSDRSKEAESVQASSEAGLTLSSTIVEDKNTVEQFFNNKKTFTEEVLYLIDPQNKNMIIKCQLDQEKSAGKKEFSKQDYACDKPVEKAKLKLQKEDDKKLTAKEKDKPKKKKEEVAPLPVDLKSYDQIKKIMDNN